MIIGRGMETAERLRHNELKEMVIDNFVAILALINNDFPDTKRLKELAGAMYIGVLEYGQDDQVLQEIEFDVRNSIRGLMH